MFCLVSLSGMEYDIRFKRVYEAIEPTDGARVLVDRLWPRGKRREDLQLTEWDRNAAPSTSLRRAWHKGQIDAETFSNDYHHELTTQPDTLLPLMRFARKGAVTLLTAVRVPEQSHLPVLRDALHAALQREDGEADGVEPSSPVCYRKQE